MRPNRPIAFTTPADAPRWQRWLRYSPAARIAIFSAGMAVLMLLARLLARWWGWSERTAPPPAQAASYLLFMVPTTLAAYLFLCRVVERRCPDELAGRRIVPDGLTGLLCGLALASAVAAASWALGGYAVTGTNAPTQRLWLWIVVFGLGSGIGEEILLRGVLFRIGEEGLGTVSALALSSLMFGILHLGNPHATAWSAIAIAVQAGLLLGLVYHLWRSLPLCMGLHAGWNIALGPLYGIPVSGNRVPSWLASSREGPDWLTGGAFGAEASVLAVAISLACSLALAALAWRRRSIVAPAFLAPRMAPRPQA